MHTGRSSFFAGAVAGALVMAGVLNAGRVIARGGGQASKYTAKVVLENDRVRVRDVTFPRSVLDTGLHTHGLPHVGVI